MAKKKEAGRIEEEQQNNQEITNKEKPISRKTLKIIVIVAAVLLLCCIVTVIFGSILNSTPEGQATNTAEAQSDLATESQETEVAAVNQTEEAKPTLTSTITQTEAPTSTPEPTSTPRPTSTPEPTATENPYLISTGTYIVGTDIEPGIYFGIAGDGLFDSCYWARLSDLSGDFDSIIANENAIGQYYVEIKETDYAFETACGLTKLEGVPEPAEFKRELEAGTYIVGRDIEPGLYKGQAGEDILESCYWARLSGVSGGFGEIISNDNATGQFFIQVSSSDFALQVGCPVSYQEE